MDMITNGFTYLAALLLLAGILVTIEKHVSCKLFRYIPAVVLLYLTAMLLCTFGIWDLEATKPTYAALKNPLTYAMVFCMLLRCDIRKILHLGPRMLIGFLSASFSIMVGFIVAFLLMKYIIGSDSWMALSALCGSWLGGSGNMIAIQSALEISEAQMGYALLIDSVNYALWVMFLLWAVQFAPQFNRWTRADTQKLDETSVRLASEANAKISPITFQNLLLLLGCSLTASAICGNLGAMLFSRFPALDRSTWTILCIIILGLIAAVSPLGKTSGTAEVSNLLLYTVIALLASRASLLELGNAPMWIITGFIILAVHAGLMLLLSRIFQLDLFTACVASLANIGGTASAPILAGAYSGSLVPVGILMALMGYVIGTPCGLLVARIMENLA